MAIVFVGPDLAKNVFAVHSVDEHGRPVLVGTSVARDKLLALLVARRPCTSDEFIREQRQWLAAWSSCLRPKPQIAREPAYRSLRTDVRRPG